MDLDQDLDHAALSELEANLYAQIHHDAPDTVEQFTASQKLHQRVTGSISAAALTHTPSAATGDNPPLLAASATRTVTSKSVNNTGGAQYKRLRYCADVKSGAGANPHFNKAGSSGPAKPAPHKRANPFATAVPASTVAVEVTPDSFVSLNATAVHRPKPFTPYTSLISQIGKTCVPPSTTATKAMSSTSFAPSPPSPNGTATIQPSSSPNTTTTTTVINPAATAATRKQRQRANKNANSHQQQQQQQRRKGGEHTAGQLRQLDRARHAQEQFQRVGAVQRLAEGKLKKSQLLRAKQERAGDARHASKINDAFVSKPKAGGWPSLAKPAHPFVTINLDSDSAVDDDDDDDVEIIPMPPPPLVCIESSDDEQVEPPPPAQDADTATAAADGDTDSIAEDFVGRRDRNRLSLCIDPEDADATMADMALGSITDNELEMISATIENATRLAANASPTVDRMTTIAAGGREANADNAVVFATPKRSRNAAATGDTALSPNDSDAVAVCQSYEVAENGFAAVDIYESESSDFPESVYEKGVAVATAATDAAKAAAAAANASDSDASSIQLNTNNRAKRRRKRRSSTSNRGCSDNNDDDPADSDSDDDDDADDGADTSADGPAYVDILQATNTPYLQRGEAVANAKSKATRVPAVPPRRRRSLGSRTGRGVALTSTPTRGGDAQSDDDFVSMLSCIVHDDKVGTASAAAGSGGGAIDGDDSAELEAERPTIDARAIVENVLSKAAAKKESRRAKKSAGANSTASEWMVTDEVGQSDDSISAASSAATVKRPASAANEKRSGVAVPVAGRLTAADFFVLDSVGETDPIPEPAAVVVEKAKEVAVVVETAVDNNTVAVAEVDGPSSATATRTPPIAQAGAATDAALAGEGSGDDNASVRSCSLVVDNPELAWNDEMRSFYNKSWGGENYNQEEMLRQMPRNRFEWTISEADLFPSSPQQTRRFNRHMKCHNCREEGHRAAECHQASRPVRCHMCGGAGHREPRCPNTLCLRCGCPTKVFSRGCSRCLPLANVPCPLCKLRGHNSRDCPDKWRRYHSTTVPNTPLTKLPMVNTKPKFCCVCAGAGHLAEYCRNALRIMDGPLPMSKIQSYEESYQRTDTHRLRPDGRQLDSVAPYALISEPLEHYKFVWCVNESADRVYGRMKAATQFERPVFERVPKKRKKTRSESTAAEAGRTDKAPRTEITSPGGSRLVLNPVNACRKSGKQAKKRAERPDEMETSDIASIIAVMESLDNATDAQPDCVDVTEPTDAAAIDLSDGEEDAFAVTIDIDAVDEAVRQHMEQTATSVATKAVNQKDSAAESRSVVPTQIALNVPEPVETVELLNSENSSSASSALEAFSFVSALDEINRSKGTPVEIVMPSISTVAAAIANRPSTPPPPIISANGAAAQNKRHELETEMRRLHKEEEYLKKLKGELTAGAGSAKKKANKQRRISERVTAESADDSAVGYHVALNEQTEPELSTASSGAHNDSDSNYSFSEYFNQQPATSKPSESTALPDFIPIDSDNTDGDRDNDSLTPNDDDDEMLTPSPIDVTTAAAAANDDAGQYSEAKIYLSKDHSKYLMTRNGTAFLNETYNKHGVKLRMEWCSIGNILIVCGRPTAQDNFHADLLAYCTRTEDEMRKKQEISQQVPKNRQTLIRFIKDQITQLERPLGNVRDCFQRLLDAEKQRSKAGTRNADKARKTLNMILLGQTGLRDGAMHLTALQSNLRCLVETETKDLISSVFRNEVFQHFKYIFSSVSHDNYAEMVRDYEAMRKAGRLPTLRLDRRLLGLRILVGDATPAKATEATAAAATAAAAVDLLVVESVPLSDVIVIAQVETTATEPVPTSSAASASPVEIAVKPVDEPSPKNRSADASEAATAEPLAPTPKRPINSYNKVLACTASARKSVLAVADADAVEAPMNEQAIVAELEVVADSNVDAETATDASNPSSDSAEAASGGGRNADACASKLWSAKCQQYVEKCRAIHKIQSNENAMRRLAQVESKARDGKLSYTDYRMLMKIFDKCV